MRRPWILSALLAGLALAPALHAAQHRAGEAAKTPVIAATRSDDDLRLEGEKRFRTNCGRCHQPPHKYPPRMMATFIRHMRVRALITDEDMRLILRYMTQ